MHHSLKGFGLVCTKDHMTVLLGMTCKAFSHCVDVFSGEHLDAIPTIAYRRIAHLVFGQIVLVYSDGRSIDEDE
jgi:hypothetical protein